ncbi:SID1 transmembrane family member 1 [Balamuthia mandrillaris]
MSHNRSKQKQKEEDGEDATSLSVQLEGDDLEAEGHEEKNGLEEEEEELLGPAGEAEEGRSLLGGIETARLRRYVQQKMELAEQAKLPATLEEILEEAVQKKMKKLQPIYLKNYWKLLLVVGFFYALPAVQFVIFQYRAKETTSTVDCYYNFKCAKRLLGFDAFNNILSNAGYLIAGFSFIVIVFFTHQCGPGGNYYGLHSDPSLYYAVGLAIVWEGVFSGLYHVCPSRVNFQFDTAFMLIGTGVLFITLFQKRHPTSAPGTIRAFLFFAFLILLTSLALTGIPLAVFWTLTLVLLSPFYLQGTWQFYYHKKITPWEYVALIKVRPFRVKQKLRFLAVLIGSAITIAIIVAGIVKSTETEELENFPLTLLCVVIYFGVILRIADK